MYHLPLGRFSNQGCLNLEFAGDDAVAEVRAPRRDGNRWGTTVDLIKVLRDCQSSLLLAIPGYIFCPDVLELRM